MRGYSFKRHQTTFWLPTCFYRRIVIAATHCSLHKINFSTKYYKILFKIQIRCQTFSFLFSILSIWYKVTFQALIVIFETCNINFNRGENYTGLNKQLILWILDCEGILVVFFCLFGVYRPKREFFTYMETWQLPVKGCKFWPLLGTHGHWAVRVL